MNDNERAARLPAWADAFLAELAATSDVATAARRAKVEPADVFRERRINIVFSRGWREALCEGYDNLEMELLHRMRTGEVKPAAGAKKGVRTFENATAFRMLVAYREEVARNRAAAGTDEDSMAIIAGINAKLDSMRERHFPDEPIEGHDA